MTKDTKELTEIPPVPITYAAIGPLSSQEREKAFAAAYKDCLAEFDVDMFSVLKSYRGSERENFYRGLGRIHAEMNETPEYRNESLEFRIERQSELLDLLFVQMAAQAQTTYNEDVRRHRLNVALRAQNQCARLHARLQKMLKKVNSNYTKSNSN